MKPGTIGVTEEMKTLVRSFAKYCGSLDVFDVVLLFTLVSAGSSRLILPH
jgi:hypothetical protein